MRKNIFAVLSVLSLSLLVTACNEVKQEKVEQKQAIGVIDTARVYADSKLGLAGGDYLEKMQATMQDELVALQKGMQENPSDVLIAEFQAKYAGFQERINLEQEQVVTKLNDALQEAMDKYREDNGLEVIIAAEAVASMGKKADVTDGIINLLDGMKVEFTPIKMPEPVEAAVKAPVEAAPEVQEAPIVGDAPVMEAAPEAKPVE